MINTIFNTDGFFQKAPKGSPQRRQNYGQNVPRLKKKGDLRKSDLKVRQITDPTLPRQVVDAGALRAISKKNTIKMRD